MIERVVEHWLTSVGERGFETPFAQVLLAEGYRVLQGPVHHPFEHGKDIIALGPTGELCAFQLKSGNLGLDDLNDIHGQLFALATAAVRYPGVDPARPPDRCFLVTNGVLTPPARDRLSALNEGVARFGIVSVVPVEQEQLTSRFLAAHGRYLPVEPTEFAHLLGLTLADGTEFFPATLLEQLVTPLLRSAGTTGATQTARALASATLLTGYGLGPWLRAENHYGQAQAWLTLARLILLAAAEQGWPATFWEPAYALAFGAARSAMRDLAQEAAAREDLVVPDLTESFVYATRTLLICGAISAFYLSERQLADGGDVEAEVRAVLTRELPYARLAGEAVIPSLALSISALELLGETEAGLRFNLIWLTNLLAANEEGSEDVLPDPYHSPEECILRMFGDEEVLDDERFDGQAYTLHVAVEWLARRGARRAIGPRWPAISRMTLYEFVPWSSARVLASEDDDGRFRAWHYPDVGSWSALRRESTELLESALPDVLWQHPEFVPYLPLLLPQRFTAPVAKAIDYLGAGLVGIRFPDGDWLPPELSAED